jgi:hypothetical protein
LEDLRSTIDTDPALLEVELWIFGGSKETDVSALLKDDLVALDADLQLIPLAEVEDAS